MRDRSTGGHGRRGRLLRRALATATALALCSAAIALAGGGVNGAPGVGDPFFPKAGNGGYEVDHYDLNVGFLPGHGRLIGRERIHATTTEALNRFDLDLRGFRIKRLEVDGAKAKYARSGQELEVTPASTLGDNQQFRVRIDYAGKPQTVIDPDGSEDGWIKTDDGSWVGSEPQGAPSWFAANDTPADKAGFTINITVPRGLKAISNGFNSGETLRAHTNTWHWRERAPMATYLATATIGRFHVRQTKFDGIRSLVAVDPQVKGYGKTLSKIPSMIRFFASKYGPYPFDDVGAIVDPSSAGYSLETQTRPLLPGKVSEVTLAHELSHQWFGDSVSLTRWPDIWLNEGFATFSEWLWAQHTGGDSVKTVFEKAYATPASDSNFWGPPPGNPGDPKHLFDGTVYVRGGMTLEALREKIGDHDFYATLRNWVHDRRHGSGTTPEFIQAAEAASGKNLDHFFQVWLFDPGKPPASAAHVGAGARRPAARTSSLVVHR